MTKDSLKLSTIRVAVLDDDSDFRTYLEDFLHGEGEYEVETFAHPDELFRASGERPPEIVLLDMKMGTVHGEDVLEQLHSLHPRVCVIVITGYPSLEDMRKTFKLQVFDYLSKPFSLAQLRQTLNLAATAYGLGRGPLDRLRRDLGHRIKLLRTERDWSLKDLATSSGLSISQLSAIERGTNLPSIESLLAVSQSLERKPSELLASIEF
jgi:FixJ family two-component response regulator